MIIKCPNSFEGNTDKWKVFLAGPIQGAPKWQNELPELDNVIWISPRRDDALLNDETHRQQMEWETRALRTANIVLFWIPEQAESIEGHVEGHSEGHDYAQTTRFELGENLGRGKRIIIGAHDNFPGRLYFEYKANKYINVIHKTVFRTLDECVDALKTYIKMCEDNPMTYVQVNNYTFDDEDRVFIEKLSHNRRTYDPFYFREHDDWKKIEKWNNNVRPCDTVIYYTNDCNNWSLKYLTGNIKCYNATNLKCDL